MSIYTYLNIHTIPKCLFFRHWRIIVRFGHFALGFRHVGIINRVGLASVMGFVDARHFFFFRHTEPSHLHEGVKHDPRRDGRPTTVDDHSVDLVPQKLAFSTVKDSGEFVARVVGIGKKGDKDHTRRAGSQVYSRSVKWVVNKEIVFKQNNLKLTTDSTKDTTQNSGPRIEGIGTGTRGDLGENTKNRNSECVP